MKDRLSRRLQILLLLLPVLGLLASLAATVLFTLQSRERTLLNERLVTVERSWIDFLHASQRLIVSDELAEEIDIWIARREKESARIESFLAPDSVRRFAAADPDYGEWMTRLGSLCTFQVQGLDSLERYLLQLQSELSSRPEFAGATLLDLIRVEDNPRFLPVTWFSAYRALEEINAGTALVLPTFSSLFSGFREEMSRDLDGLFRRQNGAVALMLLSGPVLVVLLFHFRYLQLRAELSASRIAEEEALLMQGRLEQRVQERTAELEQALEEYGRINAELLRTNGRLEEALETIRTTRDAMVQQEKLAALGQLVAGLAHEVNTPLGVSLTAATYLHQRLDPGEGARAGSLFESAELLVRNLKRSADIVRYFKQLAADQTGMPRRTFDLVEYLTALTAGLRSGIEAAGCTLELILPGELVLDSYPGGFGYSVTSLVQNALEHGYGGGAGGPIVLEVEVSGERLSLRCRDSGRGMGPEELKSIFDPFFTSNRGGGSSGLGLSVTHNFVTRILEGGLSCSSESGKEALFELTAPVRREGKLYRTN